MDSPTIDLKISGQLPGEAAVTALIQYATVVRQTMQPALQARLDAVVVQLTEDASNVWRKIWKAAGVIT